MCLLPYTKYEFDYKAGTRCKHIMNPDLFQKLKSISENKEPLPLEFMDASKLLTYQLAVFVKEFLKKDPEHSITESPFFEIKTMHKGLIEMENAEKHTPAENAEWCKVFQNAMEDIKLYKTMITSMFSLKEELKEFYPNDCLEPVLFSCGMGFITVFDPVMNEKEDSFDDVLLDQRMITQQRKQRGNMGANKKKWVIVGKKEIENQ